MSENKKLTFLRLFDNPLSKYLVLKRISCMQWLFGLFSKIKKGSGTSFWCTFSAWPFLKNVLHLILYQRTTFQCHNSFLSQHIKHNVLFSSYLDSWWRHKFKVFLESTSKAMADREKRGEDKYTKIWISRERRELFRWNKKHFEGLSFWWKIKLW